MGSTQDQDKKEATAELALVSQGHEEETPIIILATGEIESREMTVFNPNLRSVALTDQRGEYVSRSALIDGDDLRDLRVSGRWFLEQEKLRTHFPQFRLVGRAAAPTRCVGQLRTNWQSVYEVRIELDSYPAYPPTVRVPGLSENPHMFRDSTPQNDGRRICYMKTELWNQNRTTLAFVVGKVAIYLNKAELYYRDGLWPGADEHASRA